MRQRLHVLHDVLLRAERGADPVAGVVRPDLRRHGPFHDRPDALAELAGGGLLLVPDRSQNPDHVGARHLRDRRLADARKGVARQARHPVVGMPRIAPTGPFLFHDALGSFGKGRLVPGAASLCERITALAGQLAIGARLLAGLGERDQGDAA